MGTAFGYHKMIGLGFESRDVFFDRLRIIEATMRAEAKNLSRCGAFVRRAARSSLRRRKATSAAGSPPSVHSKDNRATLKNIWFVYEPREHGVVVGPVKLNQVNLKQRAQRIEMPKGKKAKVTPEGRITVPHLHEHGGSIRIYEWSWDGKKWFRQDLRFNIRPHMHYRSRVARYPARPFMGPAMLKEMPKFAGLWANTVT